jgi:transcriptional regulator with XRE-family HTH domain
MGPAKKKKILTVPQAIAASMKRRREERGWSQEALALEMRGLGFPWSRMTVTEVERSAPGSGAAKGLGRQVSVQEVLGLAQVFGVGLEDLLWDPENRPLEVSETHILVKRRDLVAMIVSHETLTDEAVRLAGPVLEKYLSRVVQGYAERVRAMTKELRSTAGYIEDQLLADLHNPKEDS